MNLNYIDCHTHTMSSPDGIDSPEIMCEKAIELGLSAYAITDHCECNTWFEETYYQNKGVLKSEDPFVVYNYRERFYNSLKKIPDIKEKYSKKLNLIFGVELGQPTQGWEGAEEVSNNKSLDFIIGSLHQIRNHDDFAFLKYENYTCQEIQKLLQIYYNEMLEMTKWGKFDVLGHLTYPLRYIEGEYGITIDFSKYDDVIREIFVALVDNGKGIEINTSGLRQKYGKTFPTLKYVKMFRELGGEILSLGSDAHCAADLGKGIANGLELAIQAGFKYVACFKERRPEFIKIED